MVYYGLSMGVTDLGGDPYLNLFISGSVECFAVFVTCFTLDRFGRRICLAAGLIVGGIACLIYGLLPPGKYRK
jgi:OCT family organic cation transporter-like MFS transporter 4/5